jgi:hypothetical protein
MATSSFLKCEVQGKGTFFWKTKKVKELKPKNICIEEAKANGCEFVVDRQLTPSRRQFGYYKSVNDYRDDIGLENIHAYEVITDECKLYFDIEYPKTETCDESFINEVIASIKPNYEEFFKVKFDEQAVYMCYAHGTGEQGHFLNKQKCSFHVVINNGYYFKSNKDIKYFLNYLESKLSERVYAAIDKCVYTHNQSYKMPFQSKAGSERVQTMMNGKFKQHLVGRYSFETFVGYYEFDVVKMDKQTKSSLKHLDVGEIDKTFVFTDDCLNFYNVETLLKIFKNDDVSYDVWFMVGCVCKNEGMPFQLFNWWSNQSWKGRENVTQSAAELWGSLEKRDVGFNMGSLVKVVKRKYPNAMKEVERRLIDQVTKPTIDLKEYKYDFITYSAPYLKSINALIDDKPHYTTFVIGSDLGTGKTTMLGELLRAKRQLFNSVLVITPRAIFAQSICASLNNKIGLNKFVVYKDVAKKSRCSEDFIVCQLESLCTVKNRFDLVIMDECESILAQFESSTVTNFDAVARKFEVLMKRCNYTIWADAFVLDRSLVMCNHFRPYDRKVYIHNTYLPYSRKAVCVGKPKIKPNEALVQFFNDFVKAHPLERNVVCSASKRLSKMIYEGVKHLKTLLINSETSDDIVKAFKDVNSLWRDYQHVIYTTSITVGVSYDYKKHESEAFHNLFMYFSANSSTVRDMFQSSLRARALQNETLYYTSLSRYYGDKHFQVFDRCGLRDHVTYRMKDGACMPQWLRDLWVFNKQETNINAYHHKALLERYLARCGYKNRDVGHAHNKVPSDIEINGDRLIYHTIPNINYDEYDAIYSRILLCEADEDDKKKYLKYHFDNEVVYESTTPSDERAIMFDVYKTSHASIEEKLENIKYEKHYDIAEHYDKVKAIYQDNIQQKGNRIEEIKSILEIETTYDECFIKRHVMNTTLKDYFNENLADIKKEWCLDLRDNELKTINKVKGVLQQILHKWGFSDIECGNPDGSKRKKERIDGKEVDVGNFRLFVKNEGFKRFDKYCVCRATFLDDYSEEEGMGVFETKPPKLL